MKFRATIPLDRVLGANATISEEALREAVSRVKYPLAINPGYNLTEFPVGRATALEVDSDGLHVEGEFRDGFLPVPSDKAAKISIGLGPSIRVREQDDSQPPKIAAGDLLEFGVWHGEPSVEVEVQP